MTMQYRTCKNHYDLVWAALRQLASNHCLRALCVTLLTVAQICLYTTTAFANTGIKEINVTANRLAQERDAIFGSWSNVGRDTLDRVNALHIQQITARVPGVNLHRNSGQESLTAIRSPVLTGSGACGSFLLAEDGIPLRPAGFCNVNELFEAHFEQGSTVEIARGPGTTLYGSNALHGVLNVVGPARIGAESSLGFDFGPYERGRLKAHFSSDNSAAALTLSHDGGYRSNSGVDQQKFSARHEKNYAFGKLTSGITVTNLNQETAGFIVGEDAYKEDNLARSNPNPEAFRDAWATRAWLRLEEGTDEARWVITPYARTSNMRFLQHFLPGMPLEENGQDSIGTQTAFYYRGQKLSTVFGVDIDYSQSYLKQTQAEPTIGSAFLQETIPAGTHYDYKVDALQASPYVRLRLPLGDSTSLTAGLRYEYMFYNYDNLALDGRTRDDGTECNFFGQGCRYSRPADRNDYFSHWSPSLALQHDINHQQKIGIVVARGIRAPQTNELYRLQRAQTAADLKSETLDSVEVNLQGKSGMLNYEIAAFFMKKDNFIFRDSEFFTVSNGKTRHQGLETTLRLDLNEEFKLSLGGTYAKHQYDYHAVLTPSIGVDIHKNDIDTAPRWFGSAQIQWTPTETFLVELDWQEMGSYYTDPENQHKYQGHRLLNLRSQWQANSQLTISAQILNLLDEEYAKRADFSNFSGDRYFPGEPVGLYFGATWQF